MGARWGPSLGNQCATALLPPSGGDLPEPHFQFSGGYLVPACWLAPWKSCHCGGLALAVPELSCARHPPPPPTVTPVGALLEVHFLQQDFVLVLELSKCPGACSHWMGRGLWAQHCVFIFPCWSRVALAPWGYVLMFCCRGLWSKSKVPRSEQRAGFLEQTSLLPLPQHPSFCPNSPSHSIPLPLPGEGQVSPLSPCPRFGLRVPYPIALPDKALSVGYRAGLGGPGWDVSPRIPMRRGSVFTPVAGGRGKLRGLCAARHPPTPAGGKGKGGLSAAPGNKESVWLVTALRKRRETNVPLIGGEVT